jgi:uncharacterized membrane protein
VIDRADGIEDGHIWNPDHFSSPSRRALFALMRRVQDHTADSITSVAGSMRFVYIHVIWFGVWIGLNVGLAGFDHGFDKFPFGLLTMIVSLEAIFLSTFVMISQNRQAARSDLRSQLDFENNIRGEVWSVHIGEALGLSMSIMSRVSSQDRGAMPQSGRPPRQPSKCRATGADNTEQMIGLKFAPGSSGPRIGTPAGTMSRRLHSSSRRTPILRRAGIPPVSGEGTGRQAGLDGTDERWVLGVTIGAETWVTDPSGDQELLEVPAEGSPEL